MKGADMQEVFLNIIEKLEERRMLHADLAQSDKLEEQEREVQSRLCGCFCRAKEIVKKEAEKCNNGWIPVEEELPETDKYILLSFSNFSIPCVGRYEEDENGGAFYVGDDDETCVSQDMFVNAWTNLPDPYQPKGE